MLGFIKVAVSPSLPRAVLLDKTVQPTVDIVMLPLGRVGWQGIKKIGLGGVSCFKFL